MLFPDFKNNIVLLSNSLLRYYGVKPFHNTLPVLDRALACGKKNIVFMILDGLGENILCRHLGKQSFLRRHHIGGISSVFPPTTTAATTSFHSGLYPLEHGWLGWMPYFKQINRVVEIFLNKDYYTGEDIGSLKVSDLLPYRTIYEQIIQQNSSVKYHQVFPDFIPGGAKSFAEICKRISDIVAKDKDTLVFVEVKTRSTTNFGHPFEAVDEKKLKNIFKAALSYLEKTNEHYKSYRIDIVSVLGTENPKIEHLKNVSLN